MTLNLVKIIVIIMEIVLKINVFVHKIGKFMIVALKVKIMNFS